MRLPWQNKKTTEVLTPLDGYNKWAAHYGEESNPVKNFSNEFIEKWIPDVRGKSVLDAGCGTGHFCQLLEKKQASKIVGLDLSPAMIEIAKRNSPTANFVCQDMSTQSVGKENFDVIICALVLGHIPDIRPALENLISALKKGGTILISDFHPYLTLHGSRRTFKDVSGKTFEVKHHLHLFRDFIQIFRHHQVVIENWEEPLWQGRPAIYVLQAKKL